MDVLMAGLSAITATGPAFDLAALDRIAAFAHEHIKPITDPTCEWLKVQNAQG